MYTRKYKHSLQAVNYHFWPCGTHPNYKEQSQNREDINSTSIA